MRVMVTRDEKVLACSSKIPKPSLVARLLRIIRIARGSSKWWKARKKRRKTFLSDDPPCKKGLSKSLGALAASTDVEMKCMLSLFFATSCHASRCGAMSVRTKSTALSSPLTLLEPVSDVDCLRRRLRCFSM